MLSEEEKKNYDHLFEQEAGKPKPVPGAFGKGMMPIPDEAYKRGFIKPEEKGPAVYHQRELRGSCVMDIPQEVPTKIGGGTTIPVGIPPDLAGKMKAEAIRLRRAHPNYNVDKISRMVCKKFNVTLT